MKSQLLVGLLVLLTSAAPAQPIPTSIVKTFAIWPGVAPGMTNPPAVEPPPNDRGSYIGVVRPTLTMYLSAHPNGAAALILSGGSYKKVVRADTDGRDQAFWLNSLGIDAYVVKYRLPAEPFNPPEAAYQDAQRSLRLIRSNVFAGEFGHHTDPHRIGVIGFSAGGHLAGVMGTYYGTAFYQPVDDYDQLSARPDFMVLASAPIYSKAALQLRMNALSNSPELQRWLQITGSYPFDTAVNAQTPPTILFHGQADKKVPYMMSVAAAHWLESANVPVELHLFPGAGHDHSEDSVAADQERMVLCEKWLRARGIIPSN